MALRFRARNVPTRAATGAWILHSGLEKWTEGEESAKLHHAYTATAFPFLKRIPPTRLLRLLAAQEITTGAILLTPFISPVFAGAVLTAFSTGLLTLYLRSPALHKPGSVWPTFEGIMFSKDVWMLGIGLSMLTDAIIDARRD
jgi:uncharacterized membrane protein YphA (DoxX/SURF4 family)